MDDNTLRKAAKRTPDGRLRRDTCFCNLHPFFAEDIAAIQAHLAVPLVAPLPFPGQPPAPPPARVLPMPAALPPAPAFEPDLRSRPAKKRKGDFDHNLWVWPSETARKSLLARATKPSSTPVAQPPFATTSDAVAFDLLSHDLLVEIIRRSRPAVVIPIAGRALMQACRTESTIQRSWKSHVVFHTPIHDGMYRVREIKEGFRPNPTASRLARFLKIRMLPTKATSIYENGPLLADDLSPDQPRPDHFFDMALIDWLFGNTGPFAKTARVRPTTAPNSECLASASVGNHMRSLANSTRWWTPYPHIALLASYFMRTGQAAKLHRMLFLARKHELLNALPADSTLSTWAPLMLDNRFFVRHCFFDMIQKQGSNPIPFDVFLLLTALLEWSGPIILAVSQNLPSSHLLFSRKYSPFRRPVMSTADEWMLKECTNPARKVDALDAIRMIPDARGGIEYFPFSPKGKFSYGEFKTYFMGFDAKILDTVAAEHPARRKIGWILARLHAHKLHKDVSMVRLGLKHGLFDASSLGRLLFTGVTLKLAAVNADLESLILDYCRGPECGVPFAQVVAATIRPCMLLSYETIVPNDMLQTLDLVTSAITSTVQCLSREMFDAGACSPSAETVVQTILNLFQSTGGDIAQLVIDNSHKWSPCLLDYILFDIRLDDGAIDYGRIIHHWIRDCSSPRDEAKLIPWLFEAAAKHGQSPLDSYQFSRENLTCAIALLIRSHARRSDPDRAPLRAIIDGLVDAFCAYNDTDAKSIDSQLPPWLESDISDITAATFRLMRVVDNSEQFANLIPRGNLSFEIRNGLLDKHFPLGPLYLTFPPLFTPLLKTHVPNMPLWTWALLSAYELAVAITAADAIETLRSALRHGCDSVDLAILFDLLPGNVLGDSEFLWAIGCLLQMADSAVLMEGMDLSGWKWRKAMATGIRVNFPPAHLWVQGSTQREELLRTRNLAACLWITSCVATIVSLVCVFNAT